MRRYTKFPSVRLNKIVICQSPLERDYSFLIERDIGVKFYKEQPLRIYYWHDGKRHRYTPDFLLYRVSKKQIVELSQQYR